MLQPGIRSSRKNVVRIVIIASLVAEACGNSSSSANPASPAKPTGPTGQTCRNFFTSETAITSSGSATLATSSAACSYSTSTNQLTCMHTFINTASGTVTNATEMSPYKTVADFVDEVRAIPPLTRSIGRTLTGSVVSQQTNFYDGQGRLTGFVLQASGTLTTTYTAWDSAGRPTVGTDSTPEDLAFSYDDAARTVTMTQVGGGVQGVTTTSYDSNGNPVRSVQTVNGIVTTTTYSIASTFSVCK